jgi:transposase
MVLRGSRRINRKSCIAAGILGGQDFAVDASLIAADANKQRSIPGKDCV